MLVQRVKAEAKTAGGIFLPESAVKELNEAKVLAVGPGAIDREGKRIEMSVKPGDKVLIPQVCSYTRNTGQRWAYDVQCGFSSFTGHVATFFGPPGYSGT